MVLSKRFYWKNRWRNKWLKIQVLSTLIGFGKVGCCKLFYGLPLVGAVRFALIVLFILILSCLMHLFDEMVRVIKYCVNVIGTVLTSN